MRRNPWYHLNIQVKEIFCSKVMKWIYLIICGRLLWKKKLPWHPACGRRTLDEIVGQQHIIGKDKLLYRAIKADKIVL